MARPCFSLAVLLAGASGLLLAASDPPPDRARLVVRLPESARLLVGSRPVKRGGAERVLTSPVVGEGKTYTFKLTATWDDDGRPVKVVKSVTVRAGRTRSVNLGLEAVPSLKKPSSEAL